MAEKKALRARIEGRVQGVNYRMATFHEANRLGVTGWVMNNPDSTVEAYFEGDADSVDKLVEWCWKGPPIASVSNITVSEEIYAERYMDFSVRYA